MKDRDFDSFMTGFALGAVIGCGGLHVVDGRMTSDDTNLATARHFLNDSLERFGAWVASSGQVRPDDVLLAALVGMTKTPDGFPQVLPTVPLQATRQLTHLFASELEVSQMMSALWEQYANQDIAFDMTLRKIGHVLGWGSPTHAMRHLMSDGQAASIVVAALYCTMRTPSTLQAIQIAARAPQAAEQVAMLAGSLMALRAGRDHLPDLWLNALDVHIDLALYIKKYHQYTTD